MLTVIFWGGLVSLGATLVVLPLVRNLAWQHSLVDKPGNRKVHLNCVPRLGGLAIFVGVCTGILATTLAVRLELSHVLVRVLLIGAPTAFLIGLYDDLLTVRPLKKLSLQLALSVLAYALGFRIGTISLGPGYLLDLGWGALPFTICWIAGVMNAFNMIDGLDGLAAGSALVSFTAIGVLGVLAGEPVVVMTVVCGMAAILGFLRYNRHPARMFMGDSGSMFLGFVLAVTSWGMPSVRGTTPPIFVPLLILALPLLDMWVAIVRRLVRAQDQAKVTSATRFLRSIASPDGDHMHHRLLKFGYSQKEAVVRLWIAAGILAVLAFPFLILPVPFNWVVAGVEIYLIRQVILSFDYVEFAPREMRERMVFRQEESTIGRRPALFRRVS